MQNCSKVAATTSLLCGRWTTSKSSLTDTWCCPLISRPLLLQSRYPMTCGTWLRGTLTITLHSLHLKLCAKVQHTRQTGGDWCWAVGATRTWRHIKRPCQHHTRTGRWSSALFTPRRSVAWCTRVLTAAAITTYWTRRSGTSSTHSATLMRALRRMGATAFVSIAPRAVGAAARTPTVLVGRYLTLQK